MDKSKSYNQEKIQRMNRTLVLDLIRQEGNCSRATLAHLSGLKQATITNIVNDFLSGELVVETGLLSGSKGRRSIGLKMNDGKFKVIGVQMTRSFFSVGLFGLSGCLFSKENFKISRHEKAEITVERIRAAILNLIQSEGACKILAVTVAMPGPYREDIDRLLFVTDLPDWENYPIREVLSRELEVSLFVVNDAGASAFAQYWYKQGQFLLYVVAGQGVGASLILNGKLANGRNGIAWEFGHTTINYGGPRCECGNYGCLEKYCSVGVLCENIGKRLRSGEPSCLHLGELSVETITAAVRGDDVVACEEYKKVCDYLAIGIVNLINMANMNIVIIGDVLTHIAPDLLLDAVNAKVRECIHPLLQSDLSIKINSLDENPALLGAGAIAAQHAIENVSVLLKEDSSQSPE